jgi:hypothetical protein
MKLKILSIHSHLPTAVTQPWDTDTKTRLDRFACALWSTPTHYALHLFNLLLSILFYPPPPQKNPTNVFWDTRSAKGNIIMPNCGTLGIAALRRD